MKIIDYVGLTVAGLASLTITIILAIAILSFLVTPLLAGTDDSALQVYTITGDKLMTMAPDAALAGDNPYSPFCYNVLNTANGLQKFTGGEKVFTTPSDYAGDGITKDPQYPLGLIHIAGGTKYLGVTWNVNNTTAEIGIFNGDYRPYTYYNGNTIASASFASQKAYLNTTAQQDLQGYYVYANRCFKGFPYIDTEAKLAVLMYGHRQLMRMPIGGGSASFTSFPTVSGTYQTPIGAAVWKNRLFYISQQGYLVWSQAAVYHNFTSSDTEGGIMAVNGLAGTSNPNAALAANKDALYLFSTNGTWMLSGGDSAAEWQFEKLNNDIYAGYGNGVAQTPNGVIYYTTTSGNIMKIEGAIVSKVAVLPVAPEADIVCTLGGTIGERYVMFSRERKYGHTYDVYPTLLYVYDTLANMFSIVTNVTTLSDNSMIASAKNWSYSATNPSTLGQNCSGFDLYNPNKIQQSYRNSSVSIPYVRADMPTRYYSNWLTCDGNEGTIKKFHRIEFDFSWDTEEVYYEKNWQNSLMDSNFYFISDLLLYYKTSISPSFTIYATASKNWGNVITRTYNTLEQQITYNTRSYRTLTLPLNTIGASNSIQFYWYEQGGNLNIKAIRIYYIPLGSYKTAGNGIN